MLLNVLISTIDEGIEKVQNVILKYRKDIFYIISHQYTAEEFKYVPQELKRKDVLISQIPGSGVTKSRNNSIKWHSPIFIIIDGELDGDKNAILS